MPQLGALKDPADSRDYPWRDSHIAKLARAVLLPPEANYQDFMPEAVDQGPHQSCLAEACEVAWEFLTRTKVWGLGLIETRMSARYLYLKARQDMGTFPQDSGLYPRAAFAALSHYGIPAETFWPRAGDLNEEPTPEVEDQALWRRITAYHRLDTAGLDDIRQCLASRHLVVVTIKVFGNLIPLRLGQGFAAAMPAAIEPEVGLHAIILFGYNDAVREFAAQNSWGTAWGSNGRFWLPYGYVERYAVDAWTMEA